MGFRFCPLASGSSGNCIYVGTDSTSILVDAGITCRKMCEGLESNGIDPASVSALVITHDHSDHIQGIPIFVKKYNVHIYASRGTISRIAAALGPSFPSARLHCVVPDETFTVGDISITPFEISHDASEPVAYTLTDGCTKLGMATDLGVYTEYTVDHLSNSDALYLEANHDVNMLLLGPYPYSLKQRVGSKLGHLSNDDCAELVTKVQNPHLHDVVLAHISKDNNFEELAYETVRVAVECGWKYDKKPVVTVAHRYTPTGMINI